jgi:hypothetical protein
VSLRQLSSPVFVFVLCSGEHICCCNLCCALLLHTIIVSLPLVAVVVLSRFAVWVPSVLSNGRKRHRRETRMHGDVADGWILRG